MKSWILCDGNKISTLCQSMKRKHHIFTEMKQNSLTVVHSNIG
jgi:hypothetical protein